MGLWYCDIGQYFLRYLECGFWLKILLTALHRFPVFVCFGNGLKLELKQHEDSRIRHASFNCYFCVVFPKRNAPRSGFGTISSSVIAKVYYSKIKSSLNIWNSRWVFMVFSRIPDKFLYPFPERKGKYFSHCKVNLKRLSIPLGSIWFVCGWVY